jgi:alcohol dehydrogenase class IV
MKFNYYQPTELVFGCGRIQELGAIASRFGKRTLLVTVKEFPAVRKQYAQVKKVLTRAGVTVTHFDGVVPNPTVESIAAGAKLARKFRAQSVIGLGGGSSMDSAKAIAVEATHPGSCWDYLFYKKAPTEKTLPIIAVSTTSGTGSQVTQVAVVTHTPTRDKSAIYHPNVFPRVALIDPELMITLPANMTAATGFDAFTHAFESLIHPACSPYVALLAEEAIRLVVAHLPRAIKHGADLKARSGMAWADTLGGLSIANAGVTLPHGVGMAISGFYPHIAHGQSLAVNYPAFARLTWKKAIPPFAQLARILDARLMDAPDRKAAAAAPGLIKDFLRKIGMSYRLRDFAVRQKDLPALAKQCMVLPDYKNNPYLIRDVQAMTTYLTECF